MFWARAPTASPWMSWGANESRSWYLASLISCDEVSDSSSPLSRLGSMVLGLKAIEPLG